MNEATMTDVKARLFDAFREDHALLGRALHALGASLRAGDAPAVRTVAARLDTEAGAHIAFEEADFYPALAPFLSSEEIDALYAEHANARELVTRLLTLDDDTAADAASRDALLARVEAMEDHVSDCGELFGAMGGLDAAQQAGLLDRLNAWRRRAPRWSELPDRRGPAP